MKPNYTRAFRLIPTQKLQHGAFPRIESVSRRAWCGIVEREPSMSGEAGEHSRMDVALAAHRLRVPQSCRDHRHRGHDMSRGFRLRTARLQFTERTGGEPNYGFHGVALLAMRACRIEHVSGTVSLIGGLQRVKGVRLAPSPTGSQDNTLQAWSWIPQTFSWVEPTAWCLLSLKKWAPTNLGVDPARLDEAERLLINRSCSAGGWNYGNADVLGKELRPYVPTSAIALLALQHRRDHPVVERSVDYLEKHATSERSGTALALALLALRVHGRRDDAVRSALVAQLPVTMTLQNHAAVALAAYALSSEQTYAAFTL